MPCWASRMMRVVVLMVSDERMMDLKTVDWRMMTKKKEEQSSDAVVLWSRWEEEESDRDHGEVKKEEVLRWLFVGMPVPGSGMVTIMPAPGCQKGKVESLGTMEFWGQREKLDLLCISII